LRLGDLETRVPEGPDILVELGAFEGGHGNRRILYNFGTHESSNRQMIGTAR
jgi:hypothetical protein